MGFKIVRITKFFRSFTNARTILANSTRGKLANVLRSGGLEKHQNEKNECSEWPHLLPPFSSADSAFEPTHRHVLDSALTVTAQLLLWEANPDNRRPADLC